MKHINPEAWLNLKRVVRFGDTDAAGVMHFVQLFRWCHEAWEESLEIYGLEVSSIFPNANSHMNDRDPLIGLPIIHCQADFWKPMQTGDPLMTELMPEKLDAGKFQTQFRFKLNDQYVAQALIRHQAINSLTRSCCSLPERIELWLEASSLRKGVAKCD